MSQTTGSPARTFAEKPPIKSKSEMNAETDLFLNICPGTLSDLRELVTNVFCVERTCGRNVIRASNDRTRVLKNCHFVIAGTKAKQIVVRFRLAGGFKSWPQSRKSCMHGTRAVQ